MTPPTPAVPDPAKTDPAKTDPARIDPPGIDPPNTHPARADAPATDLATLLDEPAPRPWFRRPALWASVVVLLLVGAGGWWWLASRAADAAPSYNTQPVARGNLTLTVTANGTIQPTRTISIGSELSGTVLKVNVDVNDRIKKGQVLVVLDTAKLGDQILRSQATVASARAKVAQTAATIGEAQAGLGRLEEVARLSGGKVPSLAELDTGRATLARAVADDASARAGCRTHKPRCPPTRSTCPRRRSPPRPTAWC